MLLSVIPSNIPLLPEAAWLASPKPHRSSLFSISKTSTKEDKRGGKLVHKERPHCALTRLRAFNETDLQLKLCNFIFHAGPHIWSHNCHMIYLENDIQEELMLRLLMSQGRQCPFTNTQTLQNLFGFRLWRTCPKLYKVTFKLTDFKKKKINPGFKICHMDPFFEMGFYVLNCCYYFSGFLLR